MERENKLLLGKKIKKARLNKEQSKRVVARLVGVNAISLDKYEKGVNFPEADHLVKLSVVLDIPLCELKDLAYQNSFGDNMRYIRELQYMPQSKLAEIIGVGVKAISDYEKERFRPSADNMAKICAVLSVTEDYLYNRDDQLLAEEIAIRKDVIDKQKQLKAGEYENTLGNFLQKAREKQNISWSDVYRDLHLSNSTMHNYENNTFIPNLNQLQALCNYYQMAIFDLFPATIAGKLNCIRVSRYVTINELSKKTGIPANDLQAFETGESLPTSEQVKCICKALRVTPSNVLLDV